MPRRPPLHEGIAAIGRKPVAFLIELAWRWTFGLSALLIMAYGALKYSNSIVLTEADKAALRSRVPETMAQAVVRILQDSGEQLASIVIVVALAMAASWTVLAAIGRAATLRALLGEGATRVPSLLGLSLLRAALTLAAGSATFGAMFVASFAATRGPENRPEIFIPVFLGLVAFITLGFSVLNWYLSLAPLFAARDGGNVVGAINDAFGTVRRHNPEFTRVSAAFGGARVVVITAFTILSFIPLALVAVAPPWVLWTLFALLALAYFAISDFLYLARLAAYIEILGEGSAAVAHEDEAAAAHARP